MKSKDLHTAESHLQVLFTFRTVRLAAFEDTGLGTVVTTLVGASVALTATSPLVVGMCLWVPGSSLPSSKNEAPYDLHKCFSHHLLPDPGHKAHT